MSPDSGNKYMLEYKKIYSNRFIIQEKTEYYFIIIIYLVLFIIARLFGAYKYIDVVTFLIFVSFCVLIIIFDLRFFVKYIVFFYEYATNIVGVYIIENHALVLTELGRPSRRCDALWLITFVHWIFFVVLLYNDKRIEAFFQKRKRSICIYEKNANINDLCSKILVLVLFAMLLFLLSNALQHTAGSVQQDRFIYAHNFITGKWGLVNEIFPWFLPFIALVLEQRKKKTYLLLMFLYFAYMILIGHKFGIFITTLSFSIPYFIKRFNISKLNIKSMGKVIISGTVIFGGCLGLVYTFMKRTYGSSPSLFKEYLYNRLAQQGQMWWAVYEHEKGQPIHFWEMIHGFGSFGGINQELISNNDYGIFKMMKLVTPYDIYVNKINSYSRYAFSTDASIYYYLKGPGLIIFTILAALLVLVITNWYWVKVSEYSIINVIIAGRFYQVILPFLLQSDFNVLFSKRNLLCLIIYILVSIYYSQYIQSKHYITKKVSSG